MTCCSGAPGNWPKPPTSGRAIVPACCWSSSTRWSAWRTPTRTGQNWLIAELVVNRDSAMRAYDTPSPDVPPIDNMVIHADSVTAFYLDDLRLLPDDTLNISAARATAMLYTFTGLLREANPHGSGALPDASD